MMKGKRLALFVAMSLVSSSAQVLAQDPGGILRGLGNQGPLSDRMDDKKKGSVVSVVIDGCKHPDAKVKFEEKERYSRFTNDVRALFGKFLGLESTACGPLTFEHTLKYDRSALKVSALDKEGKELETTTVITGPKEHLYLGLDLPVSTRKQLKYDSATRSLQPQDTSPQLYLSINWYFGDLASKQDNLDALSTERLSLKALALAGRRPLDSYGLGLGYQLGKYAVADLSGVSVFVGHFWTKEDQITAAGAGELNQGTGRDWRIGVTYDIGSGLKYLKAN